NLISESFLVNTTIDFLASVGGSSSAIDVVEYVMSIRNVDDSLACLLIADVVAKDPRLSITGHIVSLAEPNHDAIDLAATGFVVFDFETTGAKTPPCRVTEVGAYRVLNGEIVGEFHSLINPEMPIPLFITMLTGISDEMVRTAPKFEEVAADLLEFIGDSVLVAHNAGFDLRFLDHEVGRVYEDYRVANPSLCTVQLSRKLLPDIDNHKLKTLAAHYNVELINHHRANADALATAKVFINLLEGLKEHDIRDLGTAQKFARRSYVKTSTAPAGEFTKPGYQADAA
ncbi:MAG TPA: exonuclease domain-containing protein, partial [Pyrinomonadaceae bacterium]|nr:exonuclease domain-containing protein [Pyrinomonadaceae bacterium]